MSAAALLQSSLPGLRLVKRGKVRDVYEVDSDHLLIVATDRISAFDCILDTPIPRKGEVLTALSKFWFEKLAHIVPNHLVSTDPSEMPSSVPTESLDGGRAMLVRKAEVLPIECVVRGYLVGSGWKDYLRSGEVCGHKLPENLKESAELAEPIFTPSTKADVGHDENITESQASEIVGEKNFERIREFSLSLYNEARNYARTRGIIIADTKFEFGQTADGEVILIDEALTLIHQDFGPLRAIARASRNHHSTSNLSETTWRRWIGISSLRRRLFLLTLRRPLPNVIWRLYRLLTGKEL